MTEKTGRREYIKYVGAAAVGAVALGAGWGLYEYTKPKPEEIHSLYFMTDETDPKTLQWFDKVFYAFEEEYPEAKLKWESLSPDAYETKLASLIGAGTPPGIMLSDFSEAIRMHKEEGLLADATDLVDEIQPDPSMRAPVDGKDYMIPYQWGMSGQHWYRTDLYEEAGVEPPTTWEECLEVAEKLTTKDRWGWLVPCGGTKGSDYFLQRWSVRNGAWPWWTGSVAGGDIDCALDKEPIKSNLVDLLAFMKELHQFSPEAGNVTWGEQMELFYTDKVATSYYVGFRLPNAVADYAPEMEPYTSLFEIPYTHDCDVTWSGLEGFVIFKDADVEYAKKLIKVMFIPELYGEFLLSVPLHLLPIRASMLDTPLFQDNPFVKRHPDYIKAIKESAPKNISSAGLAENPYADSLTYGTGIYGVMLPRVCIAEDDPETVVEDAAADLRRELQKLLG